MSKSLRARTARNSLLVPLDDLLVQLLLVRRHLADVVEKARDPHSSIGVCQASDDADEVVERLGCRAAFDAAVDRL